MENKNETLVLKGTIVFLLTNVDSKSEMKAPYLYQNCNSCIPVFKENDNPFENRGLDAFDGKFVEVTGRYGRGNCFYIADIKEVEKV